ncbi:hypothetical protein [Elioraea rosea]|uniref:hypothetical protein n=1 Tax=Elioraea rosea TaxID=2492390 RepID=UPI0011835B9F|nr:hypothetical protein [Elioraea rosea]
MTTLSDTHLLVLSAAAARDDRLVAKHKRLPGASLQRVCEALAKRGLLALAELEGRDPSVLTIETQDGWRGFAVTAAGLEAIGVEDVVDERPRHERLGVDAALIEGPENAEPAPAAPTALALSHSAPLGCGGTAGSRNAAVRAGGPSAAFCGARWG